MIGGAKIAKKVFVSFDYDNDLVLKEFIVGQAKNKDSPFSIENWSLKEAAPQKSWEEKARTNIRRSDIVREERKPLIQIIGYKNGNYTSVPNAGKLYSWNWDNLKKILGA